MRRLSMSSLTATSALALGLMLLPHGTIGQTKTLKSGVRWNRYALCEPFRSWARTEVIDA
jgi:hypothetical protein